MDCRKRVLEIIQEINENRGYLNNMTAETYLEKKDAIASAAFRLKAELDQIRQQMLDEMFDTKTVENGVNDDFKGFITKSINSNYSWGVYGDFKLVIRNDDGYVNGTVLVNEALEYENAERKKLGMKPIGRQSVVYWQRNDSTILLTNVLSQELRILNSKLTDSVKGKQSAGEEMIQGIYIHPRLVNSLATWVSPSYALVVGDVMNRHQLKKKMDEDDQIIRSLRNDLGQKQNVIIDLEKLYNRISEDHRVHVRENKIIMKKLKKISHKNSTLEGTVNNMHGTINGLNGTVNNMRGTINSLEGSLDTVKIKLDRTTEYLMKKSPDIRPETEPENTHLLIIGRTNSKESIFTYKIVRTLRRDYDSNLNSIRVIYPRFEILREFATPNPTQIWNKIKREYKGIRAKYTDFDALDSEEEVLKIFEETINIENKRAKKICSDEN